MSAPLGVFGGTFDPPHFGHLRLAQEAIGAFGLERVIWIPAGRPPLRAAPLTPGALRLELSRLAIAGNPALELDDSEVHADVPSYTVNTLERLRACLGNRPLVLLLGADAFARLEQWHRWRDLLELAHLGVATRPGTSLAPETLSPELAQQFSRRIATNAAQLVATPAGRIAPFDLTPLAISATRIRADVVAGRSPRYLLPDPVLAHIYKHSLYTANHPKEPHGSARH